MSAVTCHCGSTASLRSNSLLYGREYGNGRAWICDRFPACRGMVGTHPDGRPLGTIADAETKELRKLVHQAIDPLWRAANNGRSHGRNRMNVYRWLSRITGIPPDRCHVGMFDKDDCQRALEAIEKEPYSTALERVT